MAFWLLNLPTTVPPRFARALPGGQRTTGFPPGFDYNPVPRVILDAEARQFRGRNAVYANNKAFRRTNGAITGLPGLTF